MGERCVVGKAYFDIYDKFRRDLIEGGVEKFDQIFPYYRESQTWLDAHLAACEQCRKAESEALTDIIDECPDPKLPYGLRVVEIARETLKDKPK